MPIPEDKAREQTDKALEKDMWKVQGCKHKKGIAVRG